MKSKKSLQKSKNKSNVAENDSSKAGKSTPLETKLIKWKQSTKPLKHFPFLDNQLFAEFLKNEENPIFQKGSKLGSKKSPPNLEEVQKYSSLVKYIEKYSDATELDSVLHNIAFIYNANKETVSGQLLSKKVNVQKVPKNMSIDQYLLSLIEEKKSKPIVIEIEEPEVIIIDELSTFSERKEEEKQTSKYSLNKQERINLKDISDADGLNLIRKNQTKIPRSKRVANGKDKSKAREEEEDDDDEIMIVESEVHPVKKKIKSNKKTNVEIIVDLEDESDSEKSSQVNLKEVKKTKKASLARTKDKSTQKVPENKEEQGESEVTQETPEQYMNICINNEVDSDGGEGFSFFYVNKNVYNKTKHYFEAKTDLGESCSCVGGCTDPVICPCARYNFENCGKTACYLYDQKYEKKKILNQLLSKDMHIYECTPQCACTKSLCLNSCVNEGDVNKAKVEDFIVERYHKVYKGNEPRAQGIEAKMWGLKSKEFIPASTFIIEYCGEIITRKEGDKRGEKYDSVNCNYLFDLNKHAEVETIDESTNTITLNIDGVCETRKMKQLKDIAANFPLVIDAFFYGNHSRFVNHSCWPNMVALAVHTENKNMLLPRIVFFALRDIQPGEELTIDYNCAPLKDLKNTDVLVCLCGAPNCRGYVYEEARENE